MTVVETRALTKRYRDLTAIDAVDLALEENRIHGLLGRNGAGKTTLMKLLTGQIFASSGSLRMFGEDPVENPAVLSSTCFIQESQKYPDGFRPQDVLRVAEGLHPAWDQEFAEQLVEDFRLPVRRAIRKLSRGQLSAVGIIIGLASRAPLTFFDEPYLGLDAVVRRLFFDRLLADYAEHPRTIILSTHHIDEAANLLERVVLLEEGRVVLDEEVEALRGAAIEVTGRAEEVAAVTEGARLLHRKEMGPLAAVTVEAAADAAERARRAGLQVTPVSLQDYIVHRTASAAAPTPAR